MYRVLRPADQEAEMARVTATIAQLEPAALRPARPCLHAHPPVTPSAFFRDRRPVLVAIAALFGFLALGAAVENGWLLLRWDEPVQRFVEANRTETLDRFFLTMSRFGSTIFVFPLGALLTVLTWRRCRAASIAIGVAMLSRPLLEFTMKELIERDRPDFDRMVNGVGYSFPSGHPLAAIALWGLLPVVVGLFTKRRAIWWASVVLAGVMIVGIGMSRVYLGVHWLSDVIGGLLLGSLFLIGVEYVLHHAHRFGGCGAARHSADAEPAHAS